MNEHIATALVKATIDAVVDTNDPYPLVPLRFGPHPGRSHFDGGRDDRSKCKRASFRCIVKLE